MRCFFALSLACVCFVFGCSSSDETGTASNAGGGSSVGGSGGSGGTGGLVGTSCTGNADCNAGSYCSTAKVCVATGKCAADGDCTSPQVCGKGSQTCLDPGTCAASGDCPTGQVCDGSTNTCSLGGECGKYEYTKVAPNVMILLDRSGSMSSDAGGQPRWTAAKAAIQTVTQAYDADIRFGLSTYSACLPGGCAAGSIVVPIAPNNASAVNGFLADKLAQGSSNGQNQASGGIQYLCNSGDPETSTGKSLNALVGESTLQDNTRGNAVLLLTDGAESGQCVSNGIDGPAGAAALLGQAPSVQTFVVGLGVNAASVDAIAQAGGTGQSVSANNQAELTAALDSIALSISSCNFALGTTPPDPTKLNVYFNGDPSGVPENGTDGWSYDPATNTIHFNGSSCDQIKNQQVTSIVVGYGCPGVIPK
jgi:von Willebrand factor type A domain